MAVTYQQLHPGNNGLATYGIAKELARQTTVFYAAVTGIGVGLGGGSCRAAVAIAPDFQFAAANAITGWAVPAAVGNMAAVTTGGALPYGIAFGNSQLAMGGLVPNQVGGHAERAALTGAFGSNLYLAGGNTAVLYVELTPCNACQTWLNGGGGGVPNPFNGVINGMGAPANLDVWWRWEYPLGTALGPIGGQAALGSVDGMNLWHTVEWNWVGQMNDVNGARW